MQTVGRNLCTIFMFSFFLIVSIMVTVGEADDSGKPVISPWAQLYANYSYNFSGYEDYDDRHDNNDYNAFELTRAWIGLDAKLSKSWSGRIVIGSTRADVITTKTEKIPNGETDDPNTDEDESVTEVVTELDTTRTGQFDVWITYAFFTYRPFSALGTNFGMISNAYNTQIYKYWRYNYVEFPTLYKYKMTRSLYGDLGISLFGECPKGYAGYRATYLNGEGKKSLEANSGKAAEMQIHVNPLMMFKAGKGLSFMGFFRYDLVEPGHGEVYNLLYEGLASYKLDINDKTGFSVNSEYAQKTTYTDDDNTDPVTSRMISGWTDIWFLRDLGFMGRYDYYDPNTANDKDKDEGYQDEKMYYIAGFFYNPIKQIKLCLNYRYVSYSAQILDDNDKKVQKQPDQLIYLNTEMKFK